MFESLLFTTPTQFAALALCIVAGWLFGLASASGGRRWREALRDEEVAHAQLRDEIARERRDHAAQLKAIEAERDQARRDADAARSAAPAIGATAVAGTAAAATDTGGSGWRGWFGWGRDNLSRIRGIDEAQEKRLNELGIKTYREIEKMSMEDEAALEERLGLAKGAIAQQGWREQAEMLRSGNEAEHGRRFAETA